MTRFQTLAVAVVSLLPNPLLGQFVYVTSQYDGVAVFTIGGSSGPRNVLPAGSGAISLHPTGRFAYVANGASNNVSGYIIDPMSGGLMSMAGSPFPAVSYPGSVTVDPTGKFAYATNYNSGSIDGFTINPNTGALTAISGSPFHAGMGLSSVRVDPTGRFAYILTTFSPQVFAYTINATTGALTAIPGSPIQLKFDFPVSFKVHPTGKFAYVLFSEANFVSGYTINATTGALTAMPCPVGDKSCFPDGEFLAGLYPHDIAFDPTGKFAYVPDEYFNNVLGFTINATTGALTPIAGSPFDNPGTQPEQAYVDPTGRFIYVTNSVSGGISVFTIDRTTGALTGGSLSGGGRVYSVAITDCTASRPWSEVFPLPNADLSAVSFRVRWSGLHACGAPAIQNYTIYVADSPRGWCTELGVVGEGHFYCYNVSGGLFTPWLTQITATQATFTGVSGHTYGFYSIARDAAGNVESPKSVADTFTYVSTVKPVSRVSPLPANTTSPNFPVRWSGTDAGGPGIRAYNVYVSDNGRPFALWVNSGNISDLRGSYPGWQLWFTGYLGHTYAFFSQATDELGRKEDLKSAADVTTRTPARLPEDVNGDGQITCVDNAIVKAAMGSTPGKPNWNSAADVNGDGVVNVRDLALVSQMMTPQGMVWECP